MSQENFIHPSVQKPGLIQITLLILYIHAVVRFIFLIFLQNSLSGNFAWTGFFFQLMILIIEIFLFYKISRGKTWSRNLWSILFLLGGAVGLKEFFPIDETYKSLHILQIFINSLGLIPIIFLYLKSSRNWFNAIKQT
jgi:peptidoglycan/LPS O-acetylase OafA/YrhL